MLCPTAQTNICDSSTEVGSAGVFFLVCYCLYYVAIDMYIVPHEALGAEISPNPSERTNVFSNVMISTVVGSTPPSSFPPSPVQC